MTCRECRDVTLEVARNRAAPFVERAVLAHTTGCVDCGRRLEQAVALTAGLRAVAHEAKGQSASADVEERLMAAFAAQHEQRPLVRPWRAVAMRLLPRAAAIALCAGLAAWWAKAPAPPAASPPQVARAVPPAATVALPVPASAAPREQPKPTPTQSRPLARRPSPVPAKPPVEAVGFVAIPAAAGLPDFESGEIVRLDVPVAALPNYGLEIPSGSQSAIQANLLIGQDGQARAIRLVNLAAEDGRPRR